MSVIRNCNTNRNIVNIVDFKIEKVQNRFDFNLINIITKKISLAPLFVSDVLSSDWGEVNYDLGLKLDFGETNVLFNK